MIDKIAADHSMILIRITSGDRYCKANGEDNYINSSYIAGDEIYLGIYTDKELELISFFHEMGHHLDKIDWSKGADKYTKYKSEANAWKIGIAFAKEHGVTFSKSAIKWAQKQLETYRADKQPFLKIAV